MTSLTIVFKLCAQQSRSPLAEDKLNGLLAQKDNIFRFKAILVGFVAEDAACHFLRRHPHWVTDVFLTSSLGALKRTCFTIIYISYSPLRTVDSNPKWWFIAVPPNSHQRIKRTFNGARNIQASWISKPSKALNLEFCSRFQLYGESMSSTCA